MIFFNGRAALFCSTLAMALAAGAAPADAQYLFDRLFGRQPRHEQPQVRQPAPRPVAPPRVSGPQYYTYKVDQLVPVDLAGIAAAFDAGAARGAPGAALVSEGLDTIVSGSVSKPADAPSPSPVPHLADAALFAEKEVADAMLAHYRADPAFIWVGGDGLTDRGRAALAVLRDAASHGLDPADYAVPDPAQGDAVAQARFEMAMSAYVLRYVRDAVRGRVDPNRISGYHDFAQKPVDLARALDVLGDTFAVETYLTSFHPRGRQYEALRAELADLRTQTESAIVVDPATFVRPGGSHAEFPKLLALIGQQADDGFRAQFGALLALHAGSQAYAQDLVPLIKAAQERAGVNPDGVIGPRSVAAIAGDSKAARIAKVEVALEQMRWLPQELASRHVFVNTPAFTASYVEGGEEKLSMRTVVGRNGTQTYFFQDEISYVEFHPYWGIPRSIVVNTYLPKLYADPSYLDRIGYEVTDRQGRRVSSASVNWAAYGANIPFDVRQPPGPRNSLGEMKIMFPNRHAIYMHDTPEKHLFDRESRNYSNGCIRLADPRAMAAAVLGWERTRVDERLKGAHGRANLDVKVPVYVAYFTAWPSEARAVEFFPDVYDRDSHVLNALERIGQTRAAQS